MRICKPVCSKCLLIAKINMVRAILPTSLERWFGEVVLILDFGEGAVGWFFCFDVLVLFVRFCWVVFYFFGLVGFWFVILGVFFLLIIQWRCPLNLILKRSLCSVM